MLLTTARQPSWAREAGLSIRARPDSPVPRATLRGHAQVLTMLQRRRLTPSALTQATKALADGASRLLPVSSVASSLGWLPATLCPHYTEYTLLL